MIRPTLAALLGFGLGCALPAAVQAAPAIMAAPNFDEAAYSQNTSALGFLDGINRSDTLLGNMWGLRTALNRHGISLAVQETSEWLGNTSGGTAKGFQYDGLTQMQLQLDTERAFDHPGGLLNISALDIHGHNLSANHLQTLQTASGIEADKGTRLWELWYKQNFLDEDQLNIKVGQQSIDQEFMVSPNALYFVNTMMGWPMLPSADMPAGGPAYPLSALGVRASYRANGGVTLLGGIYNGSPVKHDNGSDPQLQNNHGTSFPWNDGKLLIAEAQFAYPALGALVSPGEAQPLGWTYRIGAWYNSKSFDDLRQDDGGLSLANPLSSGNPQRHKGNYAWYVVGDQLVWRDAIDPNRTIAVFGRAMGTPLKDRNLIDFSLNAGMVFHSPFRYRTADTLGLGLGYTHVSSAASQFDRDNIAFGNTPPGPVRSSEKFIELTYQYQLKPWIQIQPDLQYVFRPGAGIPNPNNPSQRIKNELVLGVRTNISF